MVLPAKWAWGGAEPPGQGGAGGRGGPPLGLGFGGRLPEGGRWVKKRSGEPQSPKGALPEGMARPEDGDRTVAAGGRRRERGGGRRERGVSGRRARDPAGFGAPWAPVTSLKGRGAWAARRLGLTDPRRGPAGGGGLAGGGVTPCSPPPSEPVCINGNNSHTHTKKISVAAELEEMRCAPIMPSDIVTCGAQ